MSARSEIRTARLLLIDGGQSGCRAAYVRDGATVATATAPGLRRAGRRWEELRGLVDGLAPGEVDVTAAGLTGFVAEDLDALRAVLPGETLLVTSDAVTAYLGALGDEPGAVIVAGTGAIALAAAPDGRHARADGWGTLLGDDGGGYWIARRGLAAALRAHDGRDGSEPLRRAAEVRYGPLAHIARAVYDAPDPTATIAAFAPDMAAAARGGDREAAAIWEQAGRELARTVAAALARAQVGGTAPDGGAARDHPGGVAVSWAGGLFAAGELILAPFSAELARLVPHARPKPPRGVGLAGAARLAERPTRFATLIHEAGAAP
ncbi:MAG TPA: BadF/BadG/BcrA/BcrD ATPase family protein [Solirubrobacter sp.]|nr:BadF/BadG/BcrA/BcrD ATPase family protein [Solirubrobacter sp.]